MADEYQPGPPPREAIDYLRRKGIRTGWDYREIWREEHAHAFTIANMMAVDLLSDVRDSIAAAQEEGTTAEQWKRDMTATLRKRGWWGRKEEDAEAAQALKDELRRAEAKGDDPAKIAELREEIARREAALDLYVSRRLDTIWRVNLGQAAQAGAWERGQRSGRHPYVLYRIGPSRVHRAQHEAWDGLLLPKDDPFWSVANPRNGWGCKCYTRFVSESQRRRYQRDGVAQPVVGDATPGTMPVKTKLVDRPSNPDEAPALQPMQYRNSQTGKIHTGYRGIDVGFERNPGVGRGEQIGQQYALKDDRLAKDTVPLGTEVPDALDVRVKGDLGRSVGRALDAIELVHGSGNLPRIPLRRLRDPERLGTFDAPEGEAKRIGVNRDSDHPEMTTAHEIGHFLDFSGLPGKRKGWDYEQSGLADRWDEAIAQGFEVWPEMRELLEEIRASDTVQFIAERWPDDDDRHYVLSVEELFARAYAQYIAWKSGSATMKAELDRTLRAPIMRERQRQWPHDEFLPIAWAMDRIDCSSGRDGWKEGRRRLLRAAVAAAGRRCADRGAFGVEHGGPRQDPQRRLRGRPLRRRRLPLRRASSPGRARPARDHVARAAARRGVRLRVLKYTRVVPPWATVRARCLA